MGWQKWPAAGSRQGELLHVPLQPGSATADSGAAEFGGAVAQLWPLPAAVGLAGEATAALWACLPSWGGGAFSPQPGMCADSKLLVGGRAWAARQSGVGAPCGPAGWRPAGARSIIDDAIVRANFPFRRAVLIGSEGCTASAFETCYGY